MGSVTIRSIVDAVALELAAALPIVESGVSHSAVDMQEAIVDLPTLQVYPDSGTQDIASGNTHATSFGAAAVRTRQTELVIFADYYARQRSHIGEDMEALIDGVDAIFDVLEGLSPPYFSIAAIKEFRWTFERVTFVYGQQEQKFAGIRFTLTIRIF